MLLHDLRRTFGHGPQAPYRNLFHVLREGADDAALAAARRSPQAIPARSPPTAKATHPIRCSPTSTGRRVPPRSSAAGRVLVGGCRDAGAARALGLVPTHSIPAALEMARGVAGGSHRAGVLLAPPYAP